MQHVLSEHVNMGVGVGSASLVNIMRVREMEGGIAYYITYTAAILLYVSTPQDLSRWYEVLGELDK